MELNVELNEDTDEKKKKGRKPKLNNYFDEPQETAVRMYLTATTMDEKNKIYNDYLKFPLDKMISSIIRRYKLYRKDMDFNEIHTDTHSFLMTKVDKFKPSKEKKAYSYFGTICKNYLMGQILKDQKEMNRKVSYEDISADLHNAPDMIYHIDNDDVSTEEIINKFIIKLSDSMNEKNISDQEIKLGEALMEIFKNYNNIFVENTNNNKFNKNVVLFEIREMTNLSTKEIRNSLKRYKKIYQEIVNDILK
jgi:hypothetical protein